MSYPSDLSDAQWVMIEPVFARSDPRGARSKYPKRRVVEAILYRLREGCRWRALPHDFPPWDTVYDHWQRWKERGVWAGAVLVLNPRHREEKLGRGRRAPRHAILDSQSVKTAAKGRGPRLSRGQKDPGPLAPRGRRPPGHAAGRPRHGGQRQRLLAGRCRDGSGQELLPRAGELHGRPGLPPPSRAGRPRPGR